MEKPREESLTMIKSLCYGGARGDTSLVWRRGRETEDRSTKIVGEINKYCGEKLGKDCEYEWGEERSFK